MQLPTNLATEHMHEASEFLRFLFERVPHQAFMEIRAISTDGAVVKQLFFRLEQLQRSGFEQAVAWVSLFLCWELPGIAGVQRYRNPGTVWRIPHYTQR